MKLSKIIKNHKKLLTNLAFHVSVRDNLLDKLNNTLKNLKNLKLQYQHYLNKTNSVRSAGYLDNLLIFYRYNKKYYKSEIKSITGFIKQNKIKIKTIKDELANLSNIDFKK